MMFVVRSELETLARCYTHERGQTSGSNNFLCVCSSVSKHGSFWSLMSVLPKTMPVYTQGDGHAAAKIWALNVLWEEGYCMYTCTYILAHSIILVPLHTEEKSCDSGVWENHKTTCHSLTEGQSSYEHINQNKMEAELITYMWFE